MAREEVISSAVSFLQDPSVSSAPLEKRIAFLQSKNLTQEEIDMAMSRASEEGSTGSPVTNPARGYGLQQQFYQGPPPPGYSSPQYGQWPPPPELPRRDWRDWFIMATVTSGIGYGLYFLAKRYVVPLIAPPTPPQLEQDKQSIDEQFSRAFALIDQLATDTAGLKTAEEERTERLDAVLREVENVVSELKTSTRRRDEDARRIGEEVKNLKESIPKALEGTKEGNEARLKELGNELRSLKVLLGNRLNAGLGSTSASSGRTAPIVSSHSPQSSEETSIAGNAGAPSISNQSNSVSSSTATPPTSTVPPSSSDSSSGSFSQTKRSASIPAWQLAANKPKSGTSTPAEEHQGSEGT